MTDKLLIEALERIADMRTAGGDFIEMHRHELRGIAKTALAAHRSQQEAAQEPVAWGYLSGKEWRITTDPQMVEAMAQASGLKVRPLYTAPAPSESEALQVAIDALDEIALAGMSGSGQESEEGLRDWHARRAWQFISIAALAKDKIAALSASGQKGEPT